MLPLLFAVVVIAHRGEHLQRPENTLEAYQAAIDMGADFFETDVRTTRDGKLVIMHDGTVDRRTNGKGAIKDMTLEEVRRLDAGGGAKVPTFDEVLALARGKIRVYVDVKQASAADIVAALEKHGALETAVIYGGRQLLQEIAALRPQARVMPESVSVPVLRQLLTGLKPRVIAFGASDWKDEIIALAKEAKADICVDRLGSADNPAAWQDAIDRGATGIQTDHPAELIQFLKSRGHR